MARFWLLLLACGMTACSNFDEAVGTDFKQTQVKHDQLLHRGRRSAVKRPRLSDSPLVDLDNDDHNLDSPQSPPDIIPHLPDIPLDPDMIDRVLNPPNESPRESPRPGTSQGYGNNGSNSQMFPLYQSGHGGQVANGSNQGLGSPSGLGYSAQQQPYADHQYRILQQGM